jgi:hypothetical protein
MRFRNLPNSRFLFYIVVGCPLKPPRFACLVTGLLFLKGFWKLPSRWANMPERLTSISKMFWKNGRFWIALSILLVSFVCGLKAEERVSSEVGPKIVIIPVKLDLGNLPQQTRKTFDLGIANEGTKNLVIKEVSAACGCTAAVVSQKVVKPGGSGKVRVTFNSGSFSGTVEKSVFIASNDPQNPVKEFTFTAFVVPGK